MTTEEHGLPEEWVELVKEAMKSNITKEDFKQFLKKEKEKKEKRDKGFR